MRDKLFGTCEKNFFYLLAIRAFSGGYIVLRLFMFGFHWLSEWVHASVHSSITFCLVGTIQNTVFVVSPSNLTGKLLIMSGGTLYISGHGAKGQGQNWHSVYKTLWHDTDCSFIPITFKLHM